MCEHSCSSSGVSSRQTLSELDFERGIWTAAIDANIPRLKQMLEKDPEIVNKRDNGGYTALHYASKSGNLDVIRLLVGSGADIDVQTRAGKVTPLQRAALSGRIDCVMFLIDQGANVYLQDHDGKTALHRAAENNRKEVFDLLARKNPNLISVKDSKGMMASDLFKN